MSILHPKEYYTMAEEGPAYSGTECEICHKRLEVGEQVIFLDIQNGQYFCSWPCFDKGVINEFSSHLDQY